jgi:hypothetical protein
MLSLIRSIVGRTEDPAYPKHVLNSFIYRRFEGVEAPEGREKVPAMFAIIFSKLNLYSLIMIDEILP